MKRKRYLFHVTKPKNVENILKFGLLRSAATDHTAIAVYLSEKPLSWWEPGLDILRVDTAGLDGMKATTFLPESDEVMFWGDIPCWRATKDGWKPRIELVTDKYVRRKDHLRDAAKMVSPGMLREVQSTVGSDENYSSTSGTEVWMYEPQV